MLPSIPDVGSPSPALSPVLPALTQKDRLINDVQYPADSEVLTLDVLDDWIVQVDDALVDVRNGVTSIAWPMALAGFLAFAAMIADVADDATQNLAVILIDNPFKAIVALLLLCASIGAFLGAEETTKDRRKLLTLRRGYLRRRRVLARQRPQEEDLEA